MYSFKDILKNIGKAREGTTNVPQSHAMIPQRGLRSFEAMDHPEFPMLMASSSVANGPSGDHGSTSQFFNEQLIDSRIKSKKIKLPSRGNRQQLPKNIIGQKAKDLVKAEMSNQFPACQLGTLSGSSEIMPLYRLASDNEDASSPHSSCHKATAPLNSLYSLGETTVGFPVTEEKTDTHPKSTNVANRSQEFQKKTVATTLSCPKNCPCVCHLPSPFPVLNEKRPSVIMAPVARNYRALSVTHEPLQQNEDSLKRTPSINSRQNITSLVREPSDDSDEEQHLFRVDIDGLKAKFTLTEHDWDLIDVSQFPSGGRLLAGAWTSIFKRGVKESNPWCSIRFKNNHVRTENSRKINSAPFFRGAAECKHRECAVKLKLVIKEVRGQCVDVMYVGNVCHKI